VYTFVACTSQCARSRTCCGYYRLNLQCTVKNAMYVGNTAYCTYTVHPQTAEAAAVQSTQAQKLMLFSYTCAQTYIDCCTMCWHTATQGLCRSEGSLSKCAFVSASPYEESTVNHWYSVYHQYTVLTLDSGCVARICESRKHITILSCCKL
jgi:hypothetical protein